MDTVLKLKVAGFTQNTVTIDVKMFQIEYSVIPLTNTPNINSVTNLLTFK